MKYYKIHPAWAEKMNVTLKSVRHPDGWWLCLPALLTRLPAVLGERGYDPGMTIEEAVIRIGGCVYNEEEAIASQRGLEGYRMDNVKPALDPDPEASSEDDANTIKPADEAETEGSAEDSDMSFSPGDKL